MKLLVMMYGVPLRVSVDGIADIWNVPSKTCAHLCQSRRLALVSRHAAGNSLPSVFGSRSSFFGSSFSTV
jgi:hypothetical protein